MGGHFQLLYASQLGQAKSIAEDLQSDAAEHKLSVDFHCLDEYRSGFNIFESSCVVIVTSTTGDGDVPDNAIKFWNALRKRDLQSDSLKNLRFTVLGLGDTNYTNFCNGGKCMNKRLLELGASHFYNPGWADDGTGLEVVVEPWIEGLWPALKKHLATCTTVNIPQQLAINIESVDNNCIKKSDIVFTMTDTSSVNPSLQHSIPPLATNSLNVPTLPKTLLKIEYLQESVDVSDILPTHLPSAISTIQFATVGNITQLSKGDDVKQTLDLELVFDSDLDFKPGDSVGILCENDETEVKRILECLEKTQDSHVTCQLSSTGRFQAHLPQKSTPFLLLSKFCDIRTPPKKNFLRLLSEHTTNEAEQRRLQELSSKQGSADYSEYVRNPNLSLLDFLIAFPSCKPPFEILIEHLPPLQPRAYSIASSPLVDKKKIHIAFSVIQIPIGDGRQYERKGVCTGWLEKFISPQDLSDQLTQKLSFSDCKSVKIPVYFRKTTGFHLPEDESIPIIMIGPGTGVAPFVGFLQHRQQLQTRAVNWLFFGCRYNERDYLYKKELNDLVDMDVLTKLFVTFSRDGTCDKYVQDLILKNSEKFVEMVEDCKAMIYVCGDAKNMAKDVFEKVAVAFSNCKNINITDARKIVAQMQIDRKYLQDIW